MKRSRPELESQFPDRLQKIKDLSSKQMPSHRPEVRPPAIYPDLIGPDRAHGYLIEGPCEHNSGLAIVNRNVALALEGLHPGQVAVFPTHGNGAYRVDEAAVAGIQGLAELISRHESNVSPFVCIRNVYPPRVFGMNGCINLLYFAWEESLVPPEWVDHFNLCLDGILAASTFVKKSLTDSGVRVPIEVVGEGADHFSKPLERVGQTQASKEFTFLHVSSCYPRKGVDVLLQAFSQAFSGIDDVKLIVKTIDWNTDPLSQANELISAFRGDNPQSPQVVLLKDEMTQDDLALLYVSADVMVLPTRGEGFGLPMAEALLAGIPLITTAFGGHMDFCNRDNTWLVDFTFKRADSHFQNTDSIWTEPDPDDLAAKMLALYREAREKHPALHHRVSAGQASVQRELIWSRIAERIDGVIDRMCRLKIPVSPIKIGWVSNRNRDRNIVEDIRWLLEGADSERFSVRNYSIDDCNASDGKNCRVAASHEASSVDLADLELDILNDCVQCLVIQFHFRCFDLEELGSFIRRLDKKNISVVILAQTTRDVDKAGKRISLKYIAEELSLCDRILVQSVEDLNRLKVFGLVDNVTLFPPGIRNRDARPKHVVRGILGLTHKHIVGSFGALEPHLGVIQLIEAVPEIVEFCKETLLLLVNQRGSGPDSQKYRDRCLERIVELELERHVILVDDDLSPEESLFLLEACDVLVQPSQETDDCQIGIASFALATGRPFLTTDVAGSFDLERFVSILPGRSAQHIAHGLLSVLEDPDLQQVLIDRQRDLMKARSRNRLSFRFRNMIDALVRDRDKKHRECPM